MQLPWLTGKSKIIIGFDVDTQMVMAQIDDRTLPEELLRALLERFVSCRPQTTPPWDFHGEPPRPLTNNPTFDAFALALILDLLRDDPYAGDLTTGDIAMAYSP